MLIRYNGKELFLAGSKHGKVSLSSGDIIELLNYFSKGNNITCQDSVAYTSIDFDKDQPSFTNIMADYIAKILSEDDE